VSRRLATSVRAVEESHRYEQPRPVNPVVEWMRACPETVGLWCELADVVLPMRPRPRTLGQAAVRDPRVARLASEIAARSA
jgi:hypothetical protein